VIQTRIKNHSDEYKQRAKMEGGKERTTNKKKKNVLDSEHESQTSGVRLPLKARSMISSAPKWKGSIGFALSHRARASTESS